MVGRLELIIGCMFSGKSSELIKRIKKHELLGKRILVINHAKDARYSIIKDGKGAICSHDNVQASSLALNNLECALSLCADYDTIFVDEGQFFHDLHATCVKMVDTYGKHVVVSALDGTYERKPFEQVMMLVPFADDVIRLTALCLICKDGTSAAFSKRIVNVGDMDEFVGGIESYISVCRMHFAN